jgi:hypothetical protein
MKGDGEWTSSTAKMAMSSVVITMRSYLGASRKDFVRHSPLVIRGPHSDERL